MARRHPLLLVARGPSGHNVQHLGFLAAHLAREQPEQPAVLCGAPEIRSRLGAEAHRVIEAAPSLRLVVRRDLRRGRLPIAAPGDVVARRLGLPDRLERLLGEVPGWSTSLDAHAYLGALRRLAAGVGARRCYLTHLDPRLTRLILTLPGRRPALGLSGFYLDPPAVHYAELDASPPTADEARRAGEADARFERLLGSPWVDRVFVVDEVFAARAPERYRRGDKVRFMPDPAPSPSPARPVTLPAEVAGREVTMLLFGALRPSKGVFTVLDALERLDAGVRARLGVLFAGLAVDSSAAMLRRRVAEVRRGGAALGWIERFLDEGELAWLVGRADVVLAPYRRVPMSSGVLHWAAALGRPILTQDYGILSHWTRRHGLGVTVDTRDPALLAREIERLVALGRAAIRSLADPEGQARFTAARSGGAMASAVVDGLLELDD